MTKRIPYGSGEFHFAESRVPQTDGPHPVAIVIHGGFWRAMYGLDYIGPACDALTAAGMAPWNIEYRRVGPTGGGSPGTRDDASNAAGPPHTTAGRFPLDAHTVLG